MARRTTKKDEVPKPERAKVAPPAPAGFPPPPRAPGQGIAAAGRPTKKFPAGKPLAEQRAPLGEGEHVVDMGRPIGTIYHPVATAQPSRHTWRLPRVASSRT